MGPTLATVSLVLLTLFANSFQSPTSSTIECPPYHNGTIAGIVCSQEYVRCTNGVGQAATCAEGNVFFEDGCISTEHSPECQLDEDTEDEPYEQFDCLSKPDGLHALGCINSFVNCVNGQAYAMYCPDDLVFNAETEVCQESCDESQDDTIATTLPSVYISPLGSKRFLINDEFDDPKARLVSDIQQVIPGARQSKRLTVNHLFRATSGKRSTHHRSLLPFPSGVINEDVLMEGSGDEDEFITTEGFKPISSTAATIHNSRALLQCHFRPTRFCTFDEEYTFGCGVDIGYFQLYGVFYNEIEAKNRIENMQKDGSLYNIPSYGFPCESDGKLLCCKLVVI